MGIELTPAMKQYLEIKSRHHDCILLCRMGDFYELFFEDAVIAARELDITLTSRNKNKADAVPMAGFPYHAAAPYISKLIGKGYKVAVCEQIEDPKTAKGLVRRELVRIITPGLPIGADNLVTSDNVFLAAICSDAAMSSWGAAVIDIATGEFSVSSALHVENLLSELGGINIRELILPPRAPRGLSWDDLLPSRDNILINRKPEGYFSFQEAKNIIGGLLSEAEIHSLDLFRHAAATAAAGAALKYVQETQMTGLSHINRIRWYERDAHMSLDDTAKRNLELFAPLMAAERDTSLLFFLDNTVSAMGKRMLRRWLNHPLKDTVRINDRLVAVGVWRDNHLLRENLRHCLKAIPDLERLCARIAMKTSTARDLLALRESLACLPEIKTLLAGLNSHLILRADNAIDPLTEVCELISRTIVDSPPVDIAAGGTIREGCDPELDELATLVRDSVDGIAALEEREKKRTGIGSLKVGFNNVFGYYIEISRSRNVKLPDEYVRKQTLVNAERYITSDLKYFEEKVLVARDRLKEIEKQIFEHLLEQLAGYIRVIQVNAENIALLDVLAALAEVACKHDYCRPSVDNGLTIDIRDGRHPVVERMPLAERFVPNDLLVDGDEGRLLMITGPNMAGKSTYIRQAALIVIMAQMGSFVPAKAAHIGVVDKIFTRLGATDSLSRGQSTFMVEMIEVANVLKNATPRSLIILDEVGRGTGTFDGIAIAWAVAEYIHDYKHLQCRTLFATHYHQLTELAMTKKGVKNYNIAVHDSGGEMIFLRKILPGGTNRSYGIQVARMAGLPVDLINRAGEILENMEKREIDETGQPAIARQRKSKKERDLCLFGPE